MTGEWPTVSPTLAFNARFFAGTEGDSLALNLELAADGSVPTEIQLIPAGPEVVGYDGRAWTNDRPEDILAAFEADSRALPLDWDHATVLQAPQGQQAPAAAWIPKLEIRDGGAIWGVNVEWNPRGKESVANREYRYISPVFTFEPSTGRILAMHSVGLTNKPNLPLPALNREQTKEVSPMKKLLLALGLPETTTEEAAVNHVTDMKAKLDTALNQAQNPPLSLFVPRADYDTALNRATTAETSLKTIKDEALDTAINSEIDKALTEGKITPATKDYHVAQCRQEGGLDRFKAFAAAAPVVAAASGLDGKKLDEGTALNAEALQMAAMFGNSAEDLKKYGQA